MADTHPLTPVEDGLLDVAQRASSEKMRTEATGRKPYQKVYMATSTSSKSSNVPYNPANDCQDGAAVLPGENELVEANQTKLFLEVGLVHGKQPDKYIASGVGRNLQREKQRELRGIQDRDEYAMRVFVPVTDTIKPQIKFFVGCSPVQGRLRPKLIPHDRVYFYPEYWLDINPKWPAKKKASELLKACRTHAAQTKEEDKRVQPLLVANDEEKLRASHPVVTTTSGHLATYLKMQFHLYEETGNPDCLTKMLQTMKISVDVNEGYGPQTSTEGVFALLDPHEPLTPELAVKAATELQVHAGVQVEPGFLFKLHEIFMSLDQDQFSFLEKGLLKFFLEYYAEFIGTAVTANGVNEALRATALCRRTVSPSSTSSNWSNTADKGTLKVGDFHGALSNISASAACLKRFSNEITETAAEAYGGILRHKSIDDLMDRVSSAVDKDALHGLLSEVAAFDALSRRVELNRAVQIYCSDIENYTHELMIRTKDSGDLKRKRAEDNDGEDLPKN